MLSPVWRLQVTVLAKVVLGYGEGTVQLSRVSEATMGRGWGHCRESGRSWYPVHLQFQEATALRGGGWHERGV